MRIPNFIVCPHCKKPFERGHKLVKRFLCPLCSRYFFDYQIQEILMRDEKDSKILKRFIRLGEAKEIFFSHELRSVFLERGAITEKQFKFIFKLQK
jgi:hypothetical protein